MSENLEAEDLDDVQPPVIEPDEGGELHPTHTPRVARSMSNKPVDAENAQLPRNSRRNAPRARRMNLSLSRLDAWSVAKVTFLLGVAGGIVQVVAATVVWTLLDAVGLFDSLTQFLSSTGLDTSGFSLSDVLSMSTVLSAVTIFSIVEIVLFTILSTIIALLYNVVSALVGGIHVTLGDD